MTEFLGYVRSREISVTRSSSAGSSWLKSGTFRRIAVVDTGGSSLKDERFSGGKLTRLRGRCQIGARCAPCRQVTAPVIFPRSCRRHTRLEDSASETRDSSCLSARHRAVRLRQQLRSEEHTSELQSPCNLVCRLLLEKKK